MNSKIHYGQLHEVNIDPNEFKLVLFHRAMDFFVQAFVAVDRTVEPIMRIFVELSQLPGFFPCKQENSKISEYTHLLRDETLQARERFARAHFMPKVWKLDGQEAVAAFKIEYTVMARETLWPNLDLNDVVKAHRAKKEREQKMKSRFAEDGELPQLTMRYMLCAMWDGYYSHMSSRDEIVDSFPDDKLCVTTEAVNTAIHDLKLPKGPGRFKVDAQRVS